MEILFGGVTEVDIEMEQGSVLGQLITKLKDDHLKEREELFIHKDEKEEVKADKDAINTV